MISKLDSSFNGSLSATTTTPGPLVALVQSSDPIVGLYNTVAGGSTGGSNGMYPTSFEEPPTAIDGSVSTKYLNFGSGGSDGINTGFYVTTTTSSTTIARALHFATGNDAPNRDPITVTLEGSNAPSGSALNLGSSWTMIYNGLTGIHATVDPGRSTYGTQQNFSNTVPYAHYRLLVTSKRGSDTIVQYSEAKIIGYV
jgi:hypothetical protein